MRTREVELRSKLGIPETAEKVLIFGESSHWDPNWLLSSHQYYVRRIKPTLDEVIDQLSREPRRVFSAECIFFLRLYWQREPEKRDTLAGLINAGQLRLTGTGVTTPDTLLPSTEAILRDYLIGQQWLRQNGMRVEPKLAYLPDDFGHSPALPTLLAALGYCYACVTRIDGMFFVGCDFRLPSSYPLAGSSAAMLLQELQTIDFIWRAPDGSEVLTHWNAFTYFQGDMLAHRGIVRWMGTMAFPWRAAGHVGRQIEGFAKQLAPVSRTPYLFCPIGCDFNGPIHDLVALCDRYNNTRYQDSGIWVVNAAMEDYFELIEPYRHTLPLLELDPNPYWMGFYATRPRVKRVCKELNHKLLIAEQLAAQNGHLASTKGDGHHQAIAAAWDLVAIANHHDFITGTSPDQVYHDEQLPWLREATEHVDSALDQLRPAGAVRHGPGPRKTQRSLPEWRRSRDGVFVRTPHYELEVSEEAGGCLVYLLADGKQWIAAPSNDLVVYRDSGGLWRMGHEFFGGVFKPIARSSARPLSIRVFERPGELELRMENTLVDRRFVRWLYLRTDCPLIRCRITGSAPRGTTVACRFASTLDATTVEMDVPGGLLSRPLEKLYRPTYWPAHGFACLRGETASGSLAAFFSGPAAVSAAPPPFKKKARKKDAPSGELEWIVLRNATRERAFGIVPILAHPTSGTDDERHIYDYALVASRETLRPAQLASTARRLFQDDWLGESPQVTTFPIAVDNDHAMVTAFKRADQGPGLIARVERLQRHPARVKLESINGMRIQRAFLCDARERDLFELAVVNGAANVPLKRAITSVRLLVDHD